MIRDVTDFVQLEDIQKKQSEELNRTNMLTTQMNQVFDKQYVTVDKLVEDNQGNVQLLLDLRSSSQELWLLYSQFRDMMEIRAGCFKPMNIQFNVRATLKAIEKHNTYYNKVANFNLPDNLP